MKTRHLVSGSFAAILICGISATFSLSDESTEPSVPVGSLTASPTQVQVGVHPTLNWSIEYPNTVIDVIDVEPPGRITPKRDLYMDVRVLGVAFQSGSTHIPIKAYRRKEGGGWSSFFYGRYYDVNPTQILYTTQLNQGQHIDFGSKYYYGGWGPWRSTDQNTQYVRGLVNGDTPPDYAPAYNQGDIVSFMEPYLDDDGKIAIGPMDVIILFENSTSSPGSSYFDMQDIVLLVTFRTVTS